MKQSAAVLVAEDDRDFCRLLVSRLKRVGYEVWKAWSGDRAVELLQERRFDALVLDIYLPDVTGLEILEIARQRDPHAQAIIITGRESISTVVQAVRLGAFDYMVKPFDSLDVFEHSLKRALERRELLRTNERLMSQAKRNARVDELTGLANRRVLAEVLPREMTRAHKFDRALSILFIDVDDFKKTNDIYGHAIGDELLRKVAESIQSRTRSIDTACRYGGDEFVLILPETNREAASQIANRIVAECANSDLEGVAPSVSVGIAEFGVWMRDSKEMLAEADWALQRAKSNGADPIAVADQGV